MKKFRNLTKKIFKGKTNSIISLVALIECIILVVLTAYSWIESASSLVIKGNDLPISSNLNYRFDIVEGSTNMVDLSTYFRPTALYQIAQASSPDAENFYFKKADASTYRKGDTTDYNTSYYNIDFQVHNETSKSYVYYFNKSDIFEVTSDVITDENILNVAERAMRISVTAGTTSSSTRIFSIDTKTYKPVNNISGAVTANNITSIGLSGNSEYTYNTNTDPNQFVFSSTGGGDDTKINIKIWFEEKDAEFLALSAADKEALLGATVKINFQFVNTESNFQTFFFDDYTFNIKEGHEGQHITSEDQSKKMYFHFTEGTTTSVVPMTTIPTTGDYVRWVTSSDEGEATPRISDAMRKQLTQNPSSGYFFYGTYNDDTKTANVTYKWPITAPAVNDGNNYIFKALSVNKLSSGSTGYGVWDNEEIELWEFKDMAASATTNDYNNGAYQFINNAGQGRLYISENDTVNNTATRMYYDAHTDTWKGYFKKVKTPVFNYISADVYSASNVKVRWTATDPTEYEGKRIYTALGYEGTNTPAAQTTAAFGVGTWGPVELIKFSSELVDESMNKNLRYKVSVVINGTRRYYYMFNGVNDLIWGVHVPKDAGTAADAIQFQRFNSVTSTSVSGKWNEEEIKRNGSSIFYATDMAATVSRGQWHIGVFVDGTADNVVNDVLSTVENSKLEYSIDGGVSFIEMNKLDNYRWYTNDFESTVKNIKYRWTAYTGEGINTAVFDYGHALENGIYFNIAE